MRARESPQKAQSGIDKPSICFVGGARYRQPLAPEDEKKYQELAQLGEIFVVGFSAGAMPCRFTQVAHFYLLPKVSPALIRYALMCSIGALIVASLVLRRTVNIIVAQSPYEGVVAVWIKLIARAFGKRIAVVVESHGNFETDLFLQRSVNFAALYRFLMERAARFALSNADVLRAISSSTRRQLQAYVSGVPLVEFPAWTDMDAFLGVKPCEQSHDDGPIILYVGVLIRRKGIHVLLEAFDRLVDEFRDAKLLIIGEPDDLDYAENLKLRSGQGNAGDRVVFLSAMPQKELAEYMAEARVFVLPSISEGLGRVVFEAMASGTPVIGTSVGGIPDLIDDGVNGFLFEPNDVDGLTKHLRWALENPEECFTMGQRARRFAGEFFSSERYREGYAELFQLASDSVHSRVNDP